MKKVIGVIMLVLGLISGGYGVITMNSVEYQASQMVNSLANMFGSSGQAMSAPPVWLFIGAGVVLIVVGILLIAMKGKEKPQQ